MVLADAANKKKSTNKKKTFVSIKMSIMTKINRPNITSQRIYVHDGGGRAGGGPAGL